MGKTKMKEFTCIKGHVYVAKNQPNQVKFKCPVCQEIFQIRLEAKREERKAALIKKLKNNIIVSKRNIARWEKMLVGYENYFKEKDVNNTSNEPKKAYK